MRAFQAALIAALLISCADDQTAPVEQAAVVGTNLTFLRLDAAAYAAAEKSASFWAVRGQDRSVALHYTDTGEEFLRFEVGANSLQSDDSVQISVQIDDSGELAFHFEPSGLQFNRFSPAVLQIDRARANGDVDGDGDVDILDALLAKQASIWKRELPLLPWIKIPSITLIGTVQQAKVYDFTSFGMAVD